MPISNLRVALLLCAVTALLSACSAPQTREDVHNVGLRNAKLYAQEQLGMPVDDPLFRIDGEPDNLDWERYWNDYNREAERPDPEVVGWNDKMPTLFAFYFTQAGSEFDPQDVRSVWIFVDRKEGEVVGHMDTLRGLKSMGVR